VASVDVAFLLGGDNVVICALAPRPFSLLCLIWSRSITLQVT